MSDATGCRALFLDSHIDITISHFPIFLLIYSLRWQRDFILHCILCCFLSQKRQTREKQTIFSEAHEETKIK